MATKTQRPKPRPNFHGDWPIPKAWDLPGLRHIPTRFTESDSHDGNFVYNHVEDKAAMLIDRRLPIEVQRYTYLHEMLHAIHEVLDIMLEKFPEYVMTNSMYRMKHPEWVGPGEEVPQPKEVPNS